MEQKNNGIKKYLLFKLKNDEYGIDIKKITKIIQKNMKITRVPKTSDYIKGVINLRGEIIPIVNLRKRLGLEDSEFTRETGIIVLKLGDASIGIIVDSVQEVIELADASIESANDISSDMSFDYISGVGNKDGRIITLFDLEKLLDVQSE